jgi:hypothetical protein
MNFCGFGFKGSQKRVAERVAERVTERVKRVTEKGQRTMYKLINVYWGQTSPYSRGIIFWE